MRLSHTYPLIHPCSKLVAWVSASFLESYCMGYSWSDGVCQQSFFWRYPWNVFPAFPADKTETGKLTTFFLMISTQVLGGLWYICMVFSPGFLPKILPSRDLTDIFQIGYRFGLNMDSCFHYQGTTKPFFVMTSIRHFLSTAKDTCHCGF